MATLYEVFVPFGKLFEEFRRYIKEDLYQKIEIESWEYELLSDTIFGLIELQFHTEIQVKLNPYSDHTLIVTSSFSKLDYPQDWGDKVWSYLWDENRTIATAHERRVQAGNRIRFDYALRQEAIPPEVEYAIQALEAANFGDPKLIQKILKGRQKTVSAWRNYGFDPTLEIRQEAIRKAWAVVKEPVEMMVQEQIEQHRQSLIEGFFEQFKRLGFYNERVKVYNIRNDLLEELLKPAEIDLERHNQASGEPGKKIPALECISNKRWYRRAVELWWLGFSYKAICQQLKPKYDLTPKTIMNKFGKLRHKFGTKIVPTAKQIAALGIPKQYGNE